LLRSLVDGRYPLADLRAVGAFDQRARRWQDRDRRRGFVTPRGVRWTGLRKPVSAQGGVAGPRRGDRRLREDEDLLAAWAGRIDA